MKDLEKIKLIEIKELEQEFEMTFSMLVAHIRQKRLMTGENYQFIKVGAYKCKFEVLEENFETE